MAFENVYIGKEKDLKLFKGNDIIGFTFTITDEDGNAYDFTGHTDINLLVYTDEERTTTAATITSLDLAIASNVVTWTTDYSATINLAVGQYYYELTYEDASSRPITICHGLFKVV